MEGWQGWDDYAPFYDWENSRTVGRRDIPFWVDLAVRAGGTVLELGCGTGRVSLPVARRAERFVGIDRSWAMLGQLRKRFRRTQLGSRVALVRGDIRALPFRKRFRFSAVMAPYGVLQSLLRDRDLADTLQAVSRVIARGGSFAIDLVPDLPRWQQYHRKISLRGPGPGGGHLTLIETVRQDRGRRLTIFDQEFVQRQNRQRETRRFSLAFRTLSVGQISRRLEQVGVTVDAVLGDYRGREWSPDADVWVILARRR